MKIGYYIQHFPYKEYLDDRQYYKQYAYGGAEVAAYNLAVNMVKRGHQVSIFTTSIDHKDSIEKRENMTIHRYAKNLKVGRSNISFGLFYKPQKYQLDVIHAHLSVKIDGLAALLHAKRRKIPLIVTHHADTNVYRGFVHKTRIVYFFSSYVIKRCFSYADVIISPSEYYIDESRFLREYRNKIVVIPNGINVQNFDIPLSKEECRGRLGLPLDKNIILFVGNLTPYKGPDVLVRAMQKIAQEVPDTELVFVGSGKMRDELGKLAEKIGIKNHLKFTGFVEESMKPLYYKAADIFVLPSTLNTEVFPIVLLEASAAGLPMVVSNLNTFKCIIEDGYNGLFTKRGDENSLVDAIVYLLKNEDLRKKMGENARKKVKNYSWERIAEMIEEVYKSLIKQ